MPLMKPEVQQVLRQAGLLSGSSNATEGGGATVSEELDAAGLSLPDSLEELNYLVRNGSNDAIKLRALELSLRVRGALKQETAVAVPSFTIVIGDTPGIPSPFANQVNPILLPRPLLKELQENEQLN